MHSSGAPRLPTPADLEALPGMGCVLSLDDFGRGCSALANLVRLPVQILKMDREFVAGVDTDPCGRAPAVGLEWTPESIW